MLSRTAADRAGLQPPAIQTKHLHDSDYNDAAPASPKSQSPKVPWNGPSIQDSPKPESKPGHQRFVLTDPVAYRYLADDPSTQVLERRAELQGYECYIVEQWTTSRVHPTFMITTFTGNPSHVVVVGVLSVPVDELSWSPRLRVYFKALNQYHARRQQTPLGMLMVTNLSGFPSSLAVIAVPGGDVRKHRFDFFVNEDLKRLGCSGRVGLTLTQPAASTVAKFHQLYRTSDKNDIYKCVIELIKLCQSALMLFDKLEIDFADGLLCDITERAIGDWWTEIGSDHFGIEPHDGILGPTSVAGLLGLLMGARNRLHALGAPVSKDPFDVESMKQGISAFQKSQRITRTRRLDRRTFDRLHKASQKAAEKERWGMPRAVKSTVAELSGKGGEMVMDAVGRRDKAGIAEIETVDIDRFSQLVFGDRCKWLWLGKPVKKHRLSNPVERLPDESNVAELNKGLVFKPDDHGGFTWAAGRKSTVDGMPPGRRGEMAHSSHNSVAPTPFDEKFGNGEDYFDRPSLTQRANNIKDGAKTGLGKVAGAVAFRGHKYKPSVDEHIPVSPSDQKDGKRPLLRRSLTTPVSSPNSPKSTAISRNRPTPATTEQSDRLNMALSGIDRTDTRSITDSTANKVGSRGSLQPDYADRRKSDSHHSAEQYRRKASADDTTATADASIAGSIRSGIELNEVLPAGLGTEIERSTLLKRTLTDSYIMTEIPPRPEWVAPRHLSFSLAEESVLTWEHLGESEYDPLSSPRAQLAEEAYIASEAQKLRASISFLNYQTANWTATQLEHLDLLLDQADRDQDEIENMYQLHLQSVRELQTNSGALLRRERERFEEGGKEIEMLAAKLEYEINALKSKVEDVETGVKDFENGVTQVEEKVVELERQGEGGSPWRCLVM